MDICSICLKKIDSENAPILTISGYGKPRYLCPHCEELVSVICESGDRKKVSEAIEKIGASLTVASVEDRPVFSALNEMIEDAKARLENPEVTDKEGEEARSAEEPCEVTCEDVAEDVIEEGAFAPTAGEAESEDDGFDIPEELRESEDDRKKDEADKKRGKIFDTVIGWAAAAILIGAIVFFVVKFIL